MPITEDIRNHPLFSREYKRGREEGMQEGRQEGELVLLRRLLEKRFGALPPWADARLRELSVVEVESIGVQLLDASSLSDLLG